MELLAIYRLVLRKVGADDAPGLFRILEGSINAGFYVEKSALT